MQIPLVAGVGVGSTLLSAFDDALRACGVLNYNPIPLSSVSPRPALWCRCRDICHTLTSTGTASTWSRPKCAPTT
jgi:pyruvoyl-dependent arginine decarboxylase (PvlArgDC)